MIFEALDIHTHLNARTCYLRLKFARFARRGLFAPDIFLNIKCTKYWTLIDLNPFESIMSYLYYATKRHEQTVVLGGNRVQRVAQCVDLHTKFEMSVLRKLQNKLDEWPKKTIFPRAYDSTPTGEDTDTISL